MSVSKCMSLSLPVVHVHVHAAFLCYMDTDIVKEMDTDISIFRKYSLPHDYVCHDIVITKYCVIATLRNYT